MVYSLNIYCTSAVQLDIIIPVMQAKTKQIRKETKAEKGIFAVDQIPAKKTKNGKSTKAQKYFAMSTPEC